MVGRAVVSRKDSGPDHSPTESKSPTSLALHIISEGSLDRLCDRQVWRADDARRLHGLCELQIRGEGLCRLHGVEGLHDQYGRHVFGRAIDLVVKYAVLTAKGRCFVVSVSPVVITCHVGLNNQNN